MSSEHKRVIVLVHGLGSHPLMMWLLAKRLAQHDWCVINWGYRSTRLCIKTHGGDLARKLAELQADDRIQEIGLVTHSMGGIVARTALTQVRPDKLRRMVMLCPPNRGSHVATLFGRFLQPVCRAIDQLAARPDSYVNSLPVPAELEIGIIAAAYDTLVPLANTYLGVERDHLVWPYTLHTGVLFHAGVAEQITHFLQYGAFQRQSRLATSA